MNSNNQTVGSSSLTLIAPLEKDHLALLNVGINIPSAFLAKVRGGTYVTTTFDPLNAVIHICFRRYLVVIIVFQNNCEDFAQYCKTSLLVVDKPGVRISGQAFSAIGASLASSLSPYQSIR